MLIFTEAQPPQLSTLILTVTEIKVDAPNVQSEPEKVNDPNNCEPAMYWAAESPYYCIPKSVSFSREKTTVEAVHGSNAPSGWYPTYQCTWYVWTRRAVGSWNNASEWYRQAQRDGWSTGTAPVVGAIGVAVSGNHVVYIEKVDGAKVYLSERNYDNHGSYRERWASAKDFKYIY